MRFFAYLDPGSGSIIVQAIIAAIATVGFFFRRSFGAIFRKIASLFRRKKDDKE